MELVDGAVALSARRLVLPETPAGILRDSDGDQVAELVPGTERSFPPGTYVAELDGPMKVYVRLEGTLSVTATLERLEVALEAVGEMVVGARSHHQRPAATVTTTGDPEDLADAVASQGDVSAGDLRIVLYQSDLPKLDDHGVVDFDREGRTPALSPAAIQLWPVLAVTDRR